MSGVWVWRLNERGASNGGICVTLDDVAQVLINTATSGIPMDSHMFFLQFVTAPGLEKSIKKRIGACLVGDYSDYHAVPYPTEGEMERTKASFGERLDAKLFFDGEVIPVSKALWYIVVQSTLGINGNKFYYGPLSSS